MTSKKNTRSFIAKKAYDSAIKRINHVFSTELKIAGDIYDITWDISEYRKDIDAAYLKHDAAYKKATRAYDESKKI